jgi:hypothetical protein
MANPVTSPSGSCLGVGGFTPVTGFPTVGTLGVAFGGIAAGVFGVPGTLEPGAVIVVGSTLGITLEGVLTALVFRLMMAGGSTLTRAGRC